MTTRRTKLGIVSRDRNSLKPQTGFFHLRGHGSLPDHGIQLGLLPLETEFFHRFHRFTGRSDRFVCFLCPFGLGIEAAYFRAEIIFTVQIFNPFA